MFVIFTCGVSPKLVLKASCSDIRTFSVRSLIVGLRRTVMLTFNDQLCGSKADRLTKTDQTCGVSVHLDVRLTQFRSSFRLSLQIPSKMSRPRSKTKKESTLHLVLRLRGGAKKRKKKSYTTPKKNKHKRKKVKLAVLKYYKVDENGKIHRLRRECPADECGAGVFMASHFDRHYCGKCCLTYCFNKPEDKVSRLRTAVTRTHCMELYMENRSDKKKKGLWLVSARHDHAVNLNDLAKKLGVGSGNLRFAEEAAMLEKLRVGQGCATALALFCDKDQSVKFVLDSDLVNGGHERVYFHPMTNAATMGMKPEDFLKFLKETGHEPILQTFDPEDALFSLHSPVLRHWLYPPAAAPPGRMQGNYKGEDVGSWTAPCRPGGPGPVQ
ncbi:hypothetical protein JZ751_008548, partial [Albula glossodonta]